MGQTTGVVRRPQRALGLLGVAWGLTFVVVPALHLFDHHEDHVHLANGLVVWLQPQHLHEAPHGHEHEAPHDHGHERAAVASNGHAPHHGEDQPDDDAPTNGSAPVDAPEVPPPSHGSGSSAHLSLSALVARVALPSPACRGVEPLEPTGRRATPRYFLTARRARAPPRAAVRGA